VAGTPLPSVVPTSAVPQDVFVPDHLIFVRGSVVYMVHGAAEAPVPLVAGAKQPSVSPDGKRLAYITWGAQYQNYQNLMLLDIRSRTSRLLLNNAPTAPTNVETGRTADAPAWSGDGNDVYFAWSYPGAAGAPYATDLSVTRCPAAGPCAAGSATTMTRPNSQTGGDDTPAPRPGDAADLVFVRYAYATDRDGVDRALGQLRAQNLSSGSDTPLSDPLDDVSLPVWNPNGRYLTFVRTADDLQSSSIWIMAFHPPGRMADYAHAHLLVKGTPFAADLAFSPDGKEVTFLQSGEDRRLHLFIAPVSLGQNPHIGTPREVLRAGIVDGDRLAWIR
jgi:hypothetical protein